MPALTRPEKISFGDMRVRGLPNLSEEDFAAYRRHRAFHEWKMLMWESGCRLPTQELTGRSRCWSGVAIDLERTTAHVLAAHMTPV